jgi:AraC-like DNA-binding protein
MSLWRLHVIYCGDENEVHLMLLLEKLIEGLNIDVRPFAVCRVGTGARMSIPAFDDAMMHYALSGQSVLTYPGGTPIDLSPGTMVILPRHMAHDVAATGEGAAMPADLQHCGLQGQGIEVLESGWHGTGVVLLCGFVGATYQGTHGLFDYLPAAIIEHAKHGDAIGNAFATLVHELADPQPGTAAMTAALMRQCLLAVLRKRAQGGICNVPWLSALEHPKISTALRDVLLHPGRPYTLELLAGMAGMSRSAFSEHFSRTFGRTAMEFVKEVRLRRAAELLVTTKRPIKAIAVDVGYQSRSHFTQAFKQTHGLHPAAYREQGNQPSATAHS